MFILVQIPHSNISVGGGSQVSTRADKLHPRAKFSLQPVFENKALLDFFNFLGCTAWFPQPGIELVPPALEMWSLSH